MADERIITEFDANTQPARLSLEKLNAAFERGFKDAARDVNRLDDKFEQLGASVQQYGGQLQRTFDKQNRNFGEFKQDLRQTQAEWVKTGQAAVRSQNLAQAETKQTIDSQNRLQTELKQTSNEARRGGTSFKTLTAAFTVGNIAADAVQRSIRLVGDSIKTSVTRASSLNEAINKNTVAFKDQAYVTEEWAAGMADQFGIAKLEALEYVSTFGLIWNEMGLTIEQSQLQSQKLVEIAADLASIHDIDLSDALTKLHSGLVGEIRPMRRIGVLLDEHTVKTYAAANGIGAMGRELTQQEKFMARYELILEQTKEEQGDFARTSEFMANASRRAKANLGNLGTTIGKGLLPFVEAALKGFNSLFVSDQELRVRDYRAEIDGLAEALQVVAAQDLTPQAAKIIAINESIRDAVERGDYDSLGELLEDLREYESADAERTGREIADGILTGMQDEIDDRADDLGLDGEGGLLGRLIGGDVFGKGRYASRTTEWFDNLTKNFKNFEDVYEGMTGNLLQSDFNYTKQSSQYYQVWSQDREVAVKLIQREYERMKQIFIDAGRSEEEAGVLAAIHTAEIWENIHAAEERAGLTSRQKTLEDRTNDAIRRRIQTDWDYQDSLGATAAGLVDVSDEVKELGVDAETLEQILNGADYQAAKTELDSLRQAYDDVSGAIIAATQNYIIGASVTGAGIGMGIDEAANLPWVMTGLGGGKLNREFVTSDKGIDSILGGKRSARELALLRIRRAGGGKEETPEERQARKDADWNRYQGRVHPSIKDNPRLKELWGEDWERREAGDPVVWQTVAGEGTWDDKSLSPLDAWVHGATPTRPEEPEEPPVSQAEKSLRDRFRTELGMSEEDAQAAASRALSHVETQANWGQPVDAFTWGQQQWAAEQPKLWEVTLADQERDELTGRLRERLEFLRINDPEAHADALALKARLESNEDVTDEGFALTNEELGGILLTTDRAAEIAQDSLDAQREQWAKVTESYADMRAALWDIDKANWEAVKQIRESAARNVASRMAQLPDPTHEEIVSMIQADPGYARKYKETYDLAEARVADKYLREEQRKLGAKFVNKEGHRIYGEDIFGPGVKLDRESISTGDLAIAQVLARQRTGRYAGKQAEQATEGLFELLYNKFKARADNRRELGLFEEFLRGEIGLSAVSSGPYAKQAAQYAGIVAQTLIDPKDPSRGVVGAGGRVAARAAAPQGTRLANPGYIYDPVQGRNVPYGNAGVGVLIGAAQSQGDPMAAKILKTLHGIELGVNTTATNTSAGERVGAIR